MTAKIRKKPKLCIPVIASITIIIITITFFYPPSIDATYSDFLDIPEISGTIKIEDPTDRYYTKHATIAFSVAMAVAENSVTDGGTATTGKIDVLQGYLVYAISVIDKNRMTFYTFVDAGNGRLLFVSEGFSEEQIKARQLSSEEIQQRLKNANIDMTIEDIEEKRRQSEYLRNAFLELSLEDKAAILTHVVVVQLMPAEQKMTEQQRLNIIIEELVAMNHEEKIERMKQFADSLR